MTARGWLAGVVVSAVLASGTARGGDQAPRLFGVVDLSDPPAAPAVRQRVEREVAARGLTAIDDAATRKALDTAETQGAGARRMVQEARVAQIQGDCAAASVRAAAAEEAALSGLAIDEARQFARVALAVALGCADALGHAAEARTAAARLRQLGPLPPDGVSQALWERYPPAARLAAPVELTVDTEPPNARVAVNFHQVGVTPLTVEIPAGEATIEIEKTGYKKVFQRLAAVRAPAKVAVTLSERRLDRAAEIARRVLALRGADPAVARPALAQISQLARVDVLVAFVAHGGAVRVWWFDAERGEFLGAPASLPPGP